MKLIFNNSETAKDASTVSVSPSSIISNTALEKKMNEQMSKGTVVFDSVLTSSSATDQNTTTTNESLVQKSPLAKVNNA